MFVHLQWCLAYMFEFQRIFKWQQKLSTLLQSITYKGDALITTKSCSLIWISFDFSHRDTIFPNTLPSKNRHYLLEPTTLFINIAYLCNFDWLQYFEILKTFLNFLDIWVSINICISFYIYVEDPANEGRMLTQLGHTKLIEYKTYF